MSEIDTSTQVDTKPVILRGRAWGPNTWNNYDESDLNFLKEFCSENTETYYINQEVGEEGTPHLQFCFKFKNARTFNSLKKIFPKCHLEKSKNWLATINYCKKIDTAIKPNINNERTVKDPLEGKELRPFQIKILEILEQDPDDRTINWVYDRLGNAGKTTLAKHLCIKYPNECLYVGGKASDIKYGVFNFLKKNNLRVVILDLTRSLEGYVSWQGIEEIKNGIFYNTKYESAMCIYDCPHLIIFANFEPEIDKLSIDRWNIINLEDF